MSIGIRLHDTIDGTLAQRAQYVREQGFQCVHLALSKVISPAYMDPSAATCGLASEVKRALGGLDVAVLGCYLELLHPDEETYRQILKKYIAHLRLAGWMGAGVVGTETPGRAYTLEQLHTDAMLDRFISRLRPVVEAAQNLGQIVAVEPVFDHVVYNGRQARKMLDAIASPNLQIILDPVNLLHPSILDRRDEVLAEAIELLGEDVQVLHIKDYIHKDGKLCACAAGTGEMDYSAVMPFIRLRKPHIHITLENTVCANAVGARHFVEEMLK